METRTVSLLKAISYRIFGSLVTFFACFFFTGRPVISLGVSVFDFFAKILLYYVHERIWEHIKSPYGELYNEE
jgi:adenylylsulfate kinase